MKKRLLVLAVALVLTALLCACKENPMVEEKTVSAKQEMLYVQLVMQFLSLLIIFVRNAAKGW